MVVSEINERLSPKSAPPTVAEAMSGRFSPVSAENPDAIGVSATMVPTDVPMLKLTKHAVTNMPGKSKDSGKSDRVMDTVASIAPMVLALLANAPAKMKIHTIYKRFLFPAPLEKWLMLSLMV